MDKEMEQNDYLRLIAAQNEANRRLKIKSINNTLSDEKRKKSNRAIAAGISIVGLTAAVQFSGYDAEQAIALEMQALNSFDALKEYFSLYTPAMWGTLAATAVSISSYIKHSKKYNCAKQELADMTIIEPEVYLEEIEKQAKSK